MKILRWAVFVPRDGVLWLSDLFEKYSAACTHAQIERGQVRDLSTHRFPGETNVATMRETVSKSGAGARVGECARNGDGRDAE